ncbi:hypothetical protein QE152_g19499 [Popillia japonica]|uniref:CCHC-type domain-containing protein n=1 Tax=Popillia japonica TaxID=7064 RepID=A0AAW1KR86_POPJA
MGQAHSKNEYDVAFIYYRCNKAGHFAVQCREKGRGRGSGQRGLQRHRGCRYRRWQRGHDRQGDRQQKQEDMQRNQQQASLAEGSLAFIAATVGLKASSHYASILV